MGWLEALGVTLVLGAGVEAIGEHASTCRPRPLPPT